MNKPAFLVDGFTEKLVLEKICPNTKINKINCNGSSVSIESIAKRVASLIRIMNNRHYPIIIVIDREDREMSVAEIEENLKQEIIKAGVSDDIRIGVCDRMIENWILSDWEAYTETCKTENIIKPDNLEGIKGKSFIKKTYPTYQETTDGVNMLLKASPKIMYENSNSFKNFANQITDINCEWLNTLF
jgi:hypothetical protein